MRGRKQRIGNVVPMVGAGGDVERHRQEMAKRKAREMRPRGLPAEISREWDRVAALLADPAIDRLHARFADVIVEYCRATVRLRALRAQMPSLEDEVYSSETRNGIQHKSRPEVAQLNETWRQWRSLVALLGLSPADERNLAPGQADLFDDPADSYFGR